MDKTEAMMMASLQSFNELVDYFNSSRAALLYLAKNGKVLDDDLVSELEALVKEEDANFQFITEYYRSYQHD